MCAQFSAPASFAVYALVITPFVPVLYTGLPPSAQGVSTPRPIGIREPYGFPVAVFVTAQVIVYGLPNGTIRGFTAAVIRGWFVPLTVIVWPAYGVGSYGVPKTGPPYGPTMTPVTLNVPFAVDATLSRPVQVPLASVPAVRFRAAETMSPRPPVPPV